MNMLKTVANYISFLCFCFTNSCKVTYRYTKGGMTQHDAKVLAKIDTYDKAKSNLRYAAFRQSIDRLMDKAIAEFFSC